MNRMKARIREVLYSVAIVTSLAAPALSSAQQKELSVDELEQYIAEQKQALEEVRANREASEKKASEVQEALDEQEARRQRVEDEMKALCTEQEALKPDSFDECMQQSDS